MIRTSAGLLYLEGEYRAELSDGVLLRIRGPLTLYISLLPSKRLVSREAFVLLRNPRPDLLDSLPEGTGYIPVIRIPEEIDERWRWRVARYLRLVCPEAIYSDDVEAASRALERVREAEGLEVRPLDELKVESIGGGGTRWS